MGRRAYLSKLRNAVDGAFFFKKRRKLAVGCLYRRHFKWSQGLCFSAGISMGRNGCTFGQDLQKNFFRLFVTNLSYIINFCLVILIVYHHHGQIIYHACRIEYQGQSNNTRSCLLCRVKIQKNPTHYRKTSNGTGHSP